MEEKITQIKKLMAAWEAEAVSSQKAAVLNEGAVQAGKAILGILTANNEQQSPTVQTPPSPAN